MQYQANGKLLIEQWILSSIGLIILLLRYIVRIRTVGLKGFDGDDYASIGTVLFTIIYAITVHEAERMGQNLDVKSDMLSTLTQKDIAQLEYGSKMELVSWYSYFTLIWSLKLTILFFYKRLTNNSYQAKLVRNLFIFNGVAYLAVFLVTTFGCFPYHLNWQVSPLAPWSCRYRPQNLITIAILNVFTSAGILCIPAPMLWKLKVQWQKKLVIALSLSSAVVVICSAIIRASVTFAAAPSAANLNRWGVRETLLGTLAVNLPILRLLFTSTFWRAGPYNPDDQPPAYRTTNTQGGADPERGVSLKAYEVGVRNSIDSRRSIMDELHRDKDAVIVQTTLQIEHHSREDEQAMARGERQQGWSNLARNNTTSKQQ